MKPINISFMKNVEMGKTGGTIDFYKSKWVKLQTQVFYKK